MIIQKFCSIKLFVRAKFGGKWHFRFTPLLWTPMRVMPNEEGTELTFTFYQRPGMSEAEFVSAVEWITTDFLTLKSLLEALRR